MHGEKTAKTQPFPSKPAPYSRTFVGENDLIDFTPELRQQALNNLKKFRWEQTPYVPPVGPESDKLGTINIGNTTGGVNWPGSGFDPETGIFYTHAHNSAITVAKYDEEEFAKVNPDQFKNTPRKPRWEAEPDYGLPRRNPDGTVSRPEIRFGGGGGRQALAEGLDGLSILKPPYGVMAAIDVNKGELMFQVPHGDTPDQVRNHPKLRGLTIPKTGQPGNVGVMITKTLLVAGDPMVTNIEPRGRGAMLRAYDKKTGAQVGQVLVPAPVVGHPMTYMANGRQHIIVGVSGGNYTGEYISFRLPATETTTTAPRQ